MKSLRWLLALLAVIGLSTLGGCGKKSAVDTAAVEKSFASAEAEIKAAAEKAINAAKAGNYPDALAELQKLAGNVKLTSDQQQAIKGLVEQVNQALGNLAGQVKQQADKAAQDASKALGDVQKSLKK